LATDILDSTASDSYPITGFSSFVVYQSVHADDCTVSKEILTFVQWVTQSADALDVV